MDNYVQDGKTLVLTAPAAATTGVPFVVGPSGEKLVAVPLKDADSGASVACQVEGVVELTKDAADNFVEGESVFWDDTNKKIDKTAAGLTPCGHSVETTATSATKIKVKLSGQPGTDVPA